MTPIRKFVHVTNSYEFKGVVQLLNRVLEDNLFTRIYLNRYPLRKTQAERQAFSQRSRKVNSKFYYRRTKRHGSQICCATNKCPSQLLQRLATRLKHPSKLLCRAVNSSDSSESALIAFPTAGQGKMREPINLDSDSY
eukprot:scaffold129277_cov43-Attheya_sp.AAC.1